MYTRPNIHRYLSLILYSLIFYQSTSLANSVDELLANKKQPEGVVFEIVSGSSKLLTTLLPDLVNDIERLRKHYPELAIAVVSHGSEQFLLMSEHQKKQAKTHSLVKQLALENDIDVHVCGTHAEWFGVSAEEFPDYVDVAPAGPSQINDYVKLGYYLITLP